MKDSDYENTQIESPTNHTDLEVSKMKSTASGLTAITQSLEYACGEMGVRRGTKTLLRLNRHFEDERRAARFFVMPYPSLTRCTASYFPETNVLVPHDSVAEKSNCPTLKLVIISVQPHLENGELMLSGKFED